MRLWKMAVALAVPAYVFINAAHKPVEAKLSASMMAKVKANAEGFSAIVMLKEKADLSEASSVSGREAKASFVYQKLAETARVSQVDLVDVLTAKEIAFQRFYISNMIVLKSADAALISELSARSDIDRIISNDEFTALPPIEKTADAPSKSDAGVEGSLVAMGVDKVWQDFGVNGKGIVVAGQDTGVEWEHPALKNQYRGLAEDGSVDHRYSWHDAIHEKFESGSNPCGIDLAEPCDDNDHGTHTLGTVAGFDGRENKIGVAPGAKWIACRNMERGVGRPSTYIECFEWFLAPYAKGEDPMTAGRPEFAPHVINNSWGCPPSEGCREAEILSVLESLQAAGIMVVASAGNDGPGCSTIKDPPAMHSAATLSVGAHNHRTGDIASFSSRGPSKFDGEVGPDVTAPGVSIRSAVTGGGYSGSMWSGTSMAGPHVAGMVALMWEAQPQLVGNIAATVDLVRSTASQARSSQSCGGVSGAEIPNNTFGYGRVNAYRAVQEAKQFAQ